MKLQYIPGIERMNTRLHYIMGTGMDKQNGNKNVSL